MSRPEPDPTVADFLIAERLKRLRNKRPRRLSREGELRPEIAKWGQTLLAGTAGNLLLGGDIGAGKTWSAWEVLDRITAAGYPGHIYIYTSAMWRDVIRPPVDSDQLRVMRQADVLFLDELGAGRVNEWELECLFSVVDERWAHRRPMIITSNVDSLRKTLGERIASRLSDGATVVIFKGDDLRRRDR